MKYKVKLDRDSIKLNLQYALGLRSMAVPGRTTVTFKGIAQGVREGLNLNGNGTYPISALIEPMIIEVEMKRDIQEYHMLGSPEKYSYNYKPTKIRCSFCKAKNLHTALDSHSLDDGEYTWENICPSCNQPNCCELEFEKVNDAKLDRWFAVKSKPKRGRPRKV